MEEAHELCDEIAILDHGKVIARGEPQAAPAPAVRGIDRRAAGGGLPAAPTEFPWPWYESNGSIEIQTADVNATLERLLRDGVGAPAPAGQVAHARGPLPRAHRPAAPKLMRWQRFLAVLGARNKEFVRDRATLGWGLAFPMLHAARHGVHLRRQERAPVQGGGARRRATPERRSSSPASRCSWCRSRVKRKRWRRCGATATTWWSSRRRRGATGSTSRRPRGRCWRRSCAADRRRARPDRSRAGSAAP